MDSGKYALDELEIIQKNLAILNRFAAHKLQGSYNMVSVAQIRKEADSLYAYHLFKNLVNSNITQEKLMQIIEGPGMKEFDRQLRIAATHAVKTINR